MMKKIFMNQTENINGASLASHPCTEYLYSANPKLIFKLYNCKKIVMNVV